MYLVDGTLDGWNFCLISLLGLFLQKVTSDKEHVKIVFFDQVIAMSVGQIQSRTSSPMSNKTLFEMLLGESLLQENIFFQIELCACQEVRDSTEFANLIQITTTFTTTLSHIENDAW